MLTTGELLKNEREKRGYTFQQIEKITKIRSKNLEAIEQSDWDQFSSQTYVIGMVRSYGKFLRINEEKLLAVFRREYELKDEIRSQSTMQKKHFTPYAQRVLRLIAIIVIIAFASYFGYQLKLFLSPPHLIIISPKQTIFKSEKKVELVGKTDKESIVTVNGERIYQNKENVFRIFIPLANPENKVIIEVVGANGKKTVLHKTLKKI